MEVVTDRYLVSGIGQNLNPDQLKKSLQPPNMAFEKLRPTGGRGGSSEPTISLRKSAGIGINQTALEEYFEGAEEVELHHDPDNNVLALEPVVEGTSDSYTLTRSDSGGSVTPKGPLQRRNLVPDVTTRYEPQWDEDEEWVVLHLDEDIGTYGEPDEEAE